MKKILLALLLFSVSYGFSQTRALDSLKKLIDNNKKEDSVRVDLLYTYSRYLFGAAFRSGQKDFRKSIYFTREAIQLTNKINRADLSSFGYRLLGDFYNSENHTDSAISALFEGLAIAERLDLKKALPHFYLNLGESYRLTDQLELADYYDHKYYDIVSKLKNDTLILYALDVLISVNYQKGKLDTADILLDRALAIARALKDNYHLNRIFMQKGEQYRQRGKYPEAVMSYHQASAHQVSYNTAGNAYLLTRFSDVFLAMNNKDSAGWYAHSALDSAKKYHLVKELGDAYEALYNYYAHFGEYKQALESKLLMDSVNNELSNSGTGHNITQAELKYQQEKKDLFASIEQSNKEAAVKRERNFEYGVIAVFVLLAVFLMYNNQQKQKAKIRIEKAYSELKTTQAQLVQSEKMASLGELTAGIAHEIQNPLNFVNNFSEVNNELLDETAQAMRDGHIEEALVLIRTLTENEKKITFHGKRADAIVKGMLQHSSSRAGVKEPTDINALADEYLRLSYHGLRAREKLFNARMETNFDPSLGLIQVVPQDIGRVLLNIFNNAFYAVMEKQKNADKQYEPNVSVTTKKNNQLCTIMVRDNGNGIPQQIIDKIFQPFFTTKPTGQGTGLGLSLSYDMVKAHGGEIRVNSVEGQFTEFVVQVGV